MPSVVATLMSIGKRIINKGTNQDFNGRESKRQPVHQPFDVIWGAQTLLSLHTLY
jgi:hypothetical protein